MKKRQVYKQQRIYSSGKPPDAIVDVYESSEESVSDRLDNLMDSISF